MRFNSNDLIEMSNAVRALALHAVACANSGHVGIILGASGIITTVFANFLRPGLDRFVLSAGHGSAMLYAVFRIICELFRAPDAQIGFLTTWGLTMGQLLSGILFVAGAAFFATALHHKN